jgi:hypothetical protein
MVLINNFFRHLKSNLKKNDFIFVKSFRSFIIFELKLKNLSSFRKQKLKL